MSVPNYYEGLSDPEDDAGSTKSKASAGSATSISWKVREIKQIKQHPADVEVVYAGPECCRSRTKVTTPNGDGEWMVCTNFAENCRLHTKCRFANRCGVGFYPKGKSKRAMASTPGLIRHGCALMCHEMQNESVDEEDRKPPASTKNDSTIQSEDELSVATETKVIFESGLDNRMWKAIEGYFEEAAENDKVVYMGLTSSDGKRYLVDTYEDVRKGYRESTVEPIPFSSPDDAHTWIMTGKNQKVPFSYKKRITKVKPNTAYNLRSNKLAANDGDPSATDRPLKAQLPENFPPLKSSKRSSTQRSRSKTRHRSKSRGKSRHHSQSRSKSRCRSHSRVQTRLTDDTPTKDLMVEFDEEYFPTSDGESASETSVDQKKNHKQPSSKSRRKHRYPDDDPSSSSSSSSSSSASSWTSPSSDSSTSLDTTLSDDYSTSDSSSSDDSETSSDSSYFRRRSRRRKSRKKKSRKKRAKSKSRKSRRRNKERKRNVRRSEREQKREARLKREKKYHQREIRNAQREIEESKHRIHTHRRDKSTGDKDRIFGMGITSSKVRKALYPAGTKHEDEEEFQALMPDVLAMPQGKVHVSDCPDSHSSRQLVDAFRVITGKGKRAERVTERDTTFNSEKRHVMSKYIDNEEDLDRAIVEINEDKHSVYERMDNNISEFLSRRNWRRDDIRNYLVNGGWPTLIRMVLELLLRLLQHVQTAKSSTGWERGEAKPTLKFHSEKLRRIRRDANTKANMILRFYTFLRDAADKKFTDPSIHNAMLADFASFASSQTSRSSNSGSRNSKTDTQKSTNSEGKTTQKKAGKCGKCKSSTLHGKIRPRIGPRKECCPFKDETDEVAKKARASLIALQLDEISTALVKEHLAKAKNESNSGNNSS